MRRADNKDLFRLRRRMDTIGVCVLPAFPRAVGEKVSFVGRLLVWKGVALVCGLRQINHGIYRE
jgi:hypothetical protein